MRLQHVFRPVPKWSKKFPEIPNACLCKGINPLKVNEFLASPYLDERRAFYVRRAGGYVFKGLYLLNHLRVTPDAVHTAL